MKKRYARFVLWLIGPALELRGPARVVNNIQFENGVDRAVFDQVVRQAAANLHDELKRNGSI